MKRVFFFGKEDQLTKFRNKKVFLLLSTSLASLFFPVIAIFALVAAFSPQVISQKLDQLPFFSAGREVYSAVLQASTKTNKKLEGDISFNLPSTFNDRVQIDSTATVSGNLTAPNIIYGLIAGTNITITGGQTPTISATSGGVLSLQGNSGNVTLIQGTGITIDGLTITNSDPGSAQKIFKNMKVGSNTITAGSNTDTLEFVAGTGVTLSADTSNKKITISNSAASGIITVKEDGTIVTSTANTLDFLGGDFDISESPAGEANVQLAGTLTSVVGVAGAFSTGTTLSVGSTMTLGGDTFSDLTGSGLSVSGGVLGVNLTTTGGSGLATSNSGLEVGAGGLSLLKGCTDTQILQWNDVASTWACATQAAVSGSSKWTQTNGVVYPNISTLDVLFGGVSTASAKFAFLNNAAGTPTMTISDSTGTNRTSLTGTGVLSTTNTQNLTFGGSTTGNIILSPSNDIAGGTIRPNVDNVTDLGQSTFNFRNIYATTYNSGANAGISLTNTSCINTIGGIVVGSGTCSATTNFWNQASGALYAGNTTVDLLIGGTATASAKFAVLNVNSGIPTASLSAGIAGGAYLSATGTVATTARQQLTIGDTNTGNIVLDSGNNVIRLADLTTNGVLYTSGGNGTLNAETQLNVARGGTGIDGSAVTDGQLLIGNDGTNGFSLANLTAGTGISITNGAGSITISQNTTGSSKWTQVDGSGILYPNISTLDLLIGGISTASAKFGFLNNAGGTPTASISANSGNNKTFFTGDGNLGTTNAQSLVLGGTSTGEIILDSGNGNIRLADLTTNGVVYTSGGNGKLNAEAQLNVARGGTGVDGSAVTDGQLLIGNDGANGFSLANLTAGSGISITNGAGSITISQNGTGASKWTQSDANGILYPNISTLDLLVGGVSSTSAKFAVLNVAGGTPTASLSAGTAGGAFLSADGSLQTTAKQSLTLGGGNSGSIVLSGFGAGIIHSNASGVLSSSAINLAGGSSEVTGVLPVANGGTGVNASTVTDGQLLIGNDGANGFSLATLTAGTGISITNGSGAITISQTGTGASKWTQNDTTGVLYPNISTLDLLVGGVSTVAAKFAVLNVAGGTPTASLSAGTAGGAFLTATGTLQTTAKQSLTLGGGNTGSVVLSGAGAGVIHSDANGVLSSSAINLAGGSNEVINILPVANGGSPFEQANGTIFSRIITQDLLIGGNATASARFHAYGSINSGTTPAASISAQSDSFAGLVIDNRGGGDILTASAGGVPKFTIQNNGTIVGSSYGTAGGIFYGTATGAFALSAAGSSGQILQSNGSGAPTWISTSSVNFWQRANGALAPLNITDDLLLGSSSTSSARAAFLNIAGGTPTASLSAGTAGGAFLTADGSLQTTTKQSLTLGGGNSGNINLSSLAFFNAGANVPSGQNLTLAGLTGNNASLYGTATTGVVAAATTNTAGLCLTSGASAPTWSACPGSGSGGSKWTELNGLLYPNNGTVDVLLGGSASNAAKFAFINVNSGTPTASISASSGNNALSLDGLGNIATTNEQTLTIGSASTGNINLVIGASNNLLVNGAPASTLGTAACVTTTNGIVTGSGTCPAAAANFIWQTGNGTIFQGNTTQDLLIGSIASTSAKFAVLNVNPGSGTPTASLSAGTAGGAFLTATGTLATTARQQLNLGDSNTGAIVLDSGTNVTRLADLTTNGVVYTSGSNGTLNSETLLSAVRGGTGVDGSAASNGTLLIGNGSGYTLANLTAGTGISITNGSGSITISQTGTGASKWTQNDTAGVLYPNISTLDLLVGGISTASARFHAYGAFNTGTTPAASISAQSNSFAGFVVDNRGSGSLFTASSSGLPRFTIQNNGNLQLTNSETISNDTNGSLIFADSGGQTLTFDLDAATPTINSSTGSLLLDASTTIGSSANGINIATTGLISDNDGSVTINDDLSVFNSFSVDGNTTLGNASGDTVTINAASWTFANDTNFVLSGGLNGLSFDTSTFSVDAANDRIGIGTTNPLTALDVRGSVGTLATASISAQSSFAALVVDNNGVGDIFTASTGGVPKFTIQNNGTLVSSHYRTAGGIFYGTATGAFALSDAGVAGQILQSNGSGAPTWISTSSVNFWQRANGALAPLNITDDLLLGSSSTSSARAAFLNIAGGTPTASLSAGTAGGSYLTATGNLQTTANQTLTLGGLGTGNIILQPLNGSGRVGINTSAPERDLEIASTNTSAFTKFNVATNDDWSIGAEALGLAFFNDTDSQYRMILDQAGNAGIGTTAAANVGSFARGLEISGGGAGAALTLTATGGKRFIIGSVNSPAGLYFRDETASAYRMMIDASGNVGVGTTTPVATLDIRGNTSHLAAASASATTSFAALIADNSGTGDIFTASQGGITRFVISPTGNIQFTGNSNVLSTLNSAATSAQTYTFPATGGTLCIQSSSSCGFALGTNYWQSVNAGTITPANTTFDLLVGGVSTASARFHLYGASGSQGTNPVASIAANTSFAGLVVDNSGSGDIFDASTSGKSRFSLTSGGELRFFDADASNYTGFKSPATLTSNAVYEFPAAFPGSDFILQSNSSGVLSWIDPGTLPSSNFFNQANGTIYEKIVTQDLLIGGISTASARFHAYGSINSGTTPAASISAQSNSFAGFVIDNRGSGDLFTASASGQNRFVINNSGNVGIGTNIPTQKLDIAGNATASGSLSLGGVFQAGVLGATVAYNRLGYGTTSHSLDSASDLFISGRLEVEGALFVDGSIVTTGTTGTVGWFQRQNGSLFANYITDDLLWGGNSTASATFRLSGAGLRSGTSPAASVSANTSFASFVIDNKGSGDLFTASASGATRFAIKNNGDVQINGSSSAVFSIKDQYQNEFLNMDNLNSIFSLFGQNTGQLNSFTTNTNEPEGRSAVTAVTVNGYAYLLGGHNSGDKNTVQYAQINSDGSIGLWSNQAITLPFSTRGAPATTYNGYIYMGGGVTSDPPSSRIIYYGKPGSDGVINSWTTSSNLLPTVNGLVWYTLKAYNGFLYAIGGAQNDGGDTKNTEIYYARINGDGSIGPFSTNTVSPWLLSGDGNDCQYSLHGAEMVNGYLYIVCSGSVYYGKVLADGSIGARVKSGNSISGTPVQGHTFTLNGYLYYIGGENASTALTSVNYAQLNNNGTIGTWKANPNILPAPRSNTGGFTANGYIYIIGGSGSTSVSNAQSTVYYTSGPRTRIAGALDLVNFSGESMASSSGSGGHLTAGDTQIVGKLSVNGNAWFGDGLGVRNNLSVVGQFGITGLDGTTPVASISGQTAEAALVIDNRGVGDLFTASSSGQNRFVIKQNGNVNIGTQSAATAPWKLYVSDYQRATASAMIENTSGNGITGQCTFTQGSQCHTGLLVKMGTPGSNTSPTSVDRYISFLRGDGALMGMITGNGTNGISYTSSGADYGEYFTIDESLLPLNYTNRDRDNVFAPGTLICQGTKGVTPCGSSNAKGLLGVISNNSGFVGSTDAPNKVLVGLVGQVPLRVSTMNGIIKNGDPLTASSIPGVAMKATKGGEIIGRALEDYTNTTAVGKTMTYVSRSWYDPDVYLTDTGNINVFENGTNPENGTPLFGVTDATGQTITRAGVFANAVAGNLQAGSIDVQKLTLAGQDVNNRLLGLEQSASQSAHLANALSDLQTQVLSLSDRIASVEANLSLYASGSALFGDNFTASSGAQLNLDKLDINDVAVSGTLSVLGRTLLSDVGITGRVNMGVLAIDGLDNNGYAAINTSTGPLKLQSTGLNGLDILDGKVLVTPTGNVTIKETLTAKVIKTTKLNIVDDIMSTTSATLSASAGSIVIDAGDTSIDIDTTALTPKSLIFVTPDQPVLIGAKKKDSDTFTIKLQTPQAAALKVNWWIVN